jgi:hypothetical protein
VHEGDQLGHLRHLHGAREDEPDRPAHDQRARDPRDAGGATRPATVAITASAMPIIP